MTIDVQRWLDDYRTAWVERDPEAAAALFTEDATYQDQPYEEPYRGRDGVREYWTKVTSTQSDIRMSYGTPIVSGDRAAVEWWVTLKNDGFELTLAGEFYLVFDPSGLVRVLREYWHFGEGAKTPIAGWGE
ncbi:MAG TPA: nuclear transport factor 2 family protein [Microbacteriaceae bacterium]|nr:nuclear transport factor 2 family protein [Microbacteriaceae bacterium]